MRKFVLGFIFALLVLLTVKYYYDYQKASTEGLKQYQLIEKQIKNVNKLVVSEGHFSEVFTYKNSKEIFGDYLKANKKALVVVNAEVSIAFDLNKIEYDIDKDNKILSIKNIPDEEIKINPDIEYYDIQADYLNPFESNDYNKIKTEVKKSLMKKIEKSTLKTNAKDRLINELAKFYILTNSFGWTLQYNETPINSVSEFEGLEFLD